MVPDGQAATQVPQPLQRTSLICATFLSAANDMAE